MVVPSAIFKIGGKILDNSKNLINTIAQLTQLFEDNIIKRIILIPGGGMIANFVRKIYREFQLNNNLAHWIAIYSMDYNGLGLKQKFPHLKLYKDYKELQKESNFISLFLPYTYLKNNDELPHTWDVTSDSITLYLAIKFGLNKCFLIKDIDGIYNSNQNIIKELSTIKFRQFKNNGKFRENNMENVEMVGFLTGEKLKKTIAEMPRV